MPLGTPLQSIQNGDLAVWKDGAFRPANSVLPGVYTFDLGSGDLPALQNANTQIRLASPDGQTSRIEALAFAGTAFAINARVAGGTRAVKLYPTNGQGSYQFSTLAYDEATQTYTAALARMLVSATEAHGAAAKGFGFTFTGTSNGATSQVTWLNLTNSQILQLSSTAPTANTFGGNVLFGVNNATADIAGQWGETISSTVSGVAVAATGTVGNITSISPTAGKWEMKAFGVIAGGATGLTAASTAKMSIVSASATNGTSGSTMTQQTVYTLIANDLVALAITSVVVNITSTTTYYLTEEVTYAAGSPTASATIVATRIR